MSGSRQVVLAETSEWRLPGVFLLVEAISHGGGSGGMPAGASSGHAAA
jgi:hypothetical protein